MAAKKKRDPNRKKKKPRKKSGPSRRPPTRGSNLELEDEAPAPLTDEEYLADKARLAAEYGAGTGLLSSMRRTAGLRNNPGEGFFSRRRPLWVWALWFGGAYGAYLLARRFLLPILFPETVDPT